MSRNTPAYSRLRSWLRFGHGRLSLRPAAYSATLILLEHRTGQSVWTWHLLFALPGVSWWQRKGRAGLWKTPNFSSPLTQFYFMTLPAVSSCYPSLLSSPFGLALARAETLRPTPAAFLLRALRRARRVSAPPPTLQTA